MKIVPNVKPCESLIWGLAFLPPFSSLFLACLWPGTDVVLDMLRTHPAYERMEKGDGLFYDPISKGPSSQNISWTDGMGKDGDGSWVDFSAPEARKWWSQGVQILIDLGVDGIWE